MALSEEDKRFLQRAIDEAELDPRIHKVGAVIVRAGRIMATAHGGEEGRQHAELTAIRKCQREGDDLCGATLYTTLEPCVPEVRSPDRQPCAVEILNHPFKRVVIGLLDPNTGVRGRGISMLSTSSLTVDVCADLELLQKIRQQNRVFFENEWPRFLAFPGFPLDLHFEGRIAERASMTEWLCRRGAVGAKPVMMLTAIGGMGKSSLTWLWAKHDVAGEEVPGIASEPEEISRRCRVEPGWQRGLRILWFSFYQHEGGGDFRRFLEEAINHFSSGTIAALDYRHGGDLDYVRLTRDLLAVLRDRRSLIIWDGAERLLNEYAGVNPIDIENVPVERRGAERMMRRAADIRVAQFLWGLTGQTSTKLLISTRLAFSDLDNVAAAGVLPLHGIDSESAVRFLQRRGIRGPARMLLEACTDYEFHPLSLSNLAAALQEDFEHTADIRGRRPEDPGVPVDERRRHVLALAYERRGSARQELLSRLAAVRSYIPKEMHRWLMSSRDSDSTATLGRDIYELVRHSLLRELAGYYEIHPVVRYFAYSRLSEKRETHKALARYYEALAKGIDLSRVETLEEISPVIESCYHFARAGEYQHMLSQLYFNSERSLGKVLFFRFGAYRICLSLALELFPRGADHPPSVPEDEQARVLQNVGSYHAYLGNPRAAVEFLRRAAAVVTSSSSIPRGDIYADLGYCLTHLGQLEEAEDNLKEMARAYEKDGLHYRAVFHSWRLAELWGFLGWFRVAQRRIDECLAFSRRISYDGMNDGGVLPSAIRISLMHGNAARAAALAERLAHIMSADSRWHGVAMAAVESRWVTGATELAQGNIDRAETLLIESLNLCRQINLLESEARILLDCARVYEAKAKAASNKGERAARVQEALHLAKEGLTIAEWCDYRIQQADCELLLAELHLMEGHREVARECAAAAQKTAACGVDPRTNAYFYRPVYEKAAALLRGFES
jgi:pyrimidine deaminase RibD-like protein/tetratricopeptide (TPR) repeat protein